ncbi:hypothetical protein KCU83_g6687, partial [Aureobasidium melanogenum]
MNPSNHPHDSHSNSHVDSYSSGSNDSIPRYGGYKHSSSCYEDFEMWNSVCEDAEPGWEYKETQRLEKKERKKVKKEVAGKEKEKNEEEKEESAETADRHVPAISGLGSPFDYQRSKCAAQVCSQNLARIMHDNKDAKDKDAILDYDTKSCQGLSLEEMLRISRPDNVKKQPRPATEARTCALM